MYQLWDWIDRVMDIAMGTMLLLLDCIVDRDLWLLLHVLWKPELEQEEIVLHWIDSSRYCPI